MPRWDITSALLEDHDLALIRRTADTLRGAEGLDRQILAFRAPIDAGKIWDVPSLIEHISAAITLEAGDVIATGTPSGEGVFRDPPVFLEPGDRVRCEVEGIGTVENPVVDWSEVDAAPD